ncbi:MAG: glycosyltransferase family 4 protein, partial [Planctomycetota bacterium]
VARVTMVLDNDLTRDVRVRKEAATLSRAGHRVRVVALRTPGAAPRERLGDIEVIRVPAAAHCGKRGVARLPELLLWYHRMAPLGREAERWPAEAVHAHDLTTLGPARRAARRLGAALVYDAHELYVETLNATGPRHRGGVRGLLQRVVEGYLRRLGTALERRWLQGIDGHITVCEGIADELARRYDVRRPTVVANCPPTISPPAPDGRLRRALAAPPDARVLLYQGTLPAHGRGLGDLIRVVARLPADVWVVLLGWGGGKARLVRMARERGVADRVTFLPPVPQEELIRWTVEATAALVPMRPVNLNNEMSLPNKLFESLMAGVPVVASGTSEIRRVLEEFPAGVLYDPGSLEDLERAIREVLDAPAKQRAAFVEAGRRATAEKWCWERQEEHLLALYDRVLGSRGPVTGSRLVGSSR